MATDSVNESPAISPTPDGARGKAMGIVFLVVFIDLLGFGIVLPLLPRYAEHFLKDFSPTMKGVTIGALYSSFSLMQFVFSPMWGRVSDRVGRRPVLMVGLAGSVVFYALFGYASGLAADAWQLALALLMLSRIGAGVAGASVGTAAAVIADCTTPEKRAKGMALIGAAFGVGFTFGPLIAYAALKFFDSAPWAPGAVASGLSLVALLVAAFVLPETLRPGPKPPRQFFSLGRTRAVLAMPRIGGLVLVYFLVIFAFANFEGTLALFTKDAFDMAADDTFLVFAFIGFVLMVVQGGVYRPLAGRMSEWRLMRLGVALLLFGLAGIALNAYAVDGLRESLQGANLRPLFYTSVAVAVAGFAFVNPSVSALLSKSADPARQGEVQGVNQSFSSLGRILGPFLGSYFFFLDPTHVLPYAVAAGVLVLVAGLLVAQSSAGDGGETP
jgi:DHA1 family tetracycline resistance protein-like MFS transporter